MLVYFLMNSIRGHLKGTSRNSVVRQGGMKIRRKSGVYTTVHEHFEENFHFRLAANGFLEVFLSKLID